MKRIVLIILSFIIIIGLNSCVEQKKGKITKEDLKTDDQKSSYVFGVDIARKVSGSNKKFDADVFIQGLKDQLEGKGTLLTQDEMKLVREQGRKEAEKLEKKAKMVKVDDAGIKPDNNIKIGEKFLEENKKKDGVIVTPSGLQYKVITQGTGQKPKAVDNIKVHYAGFLISGEEFDSSYKREKPTEFRLGGVIKGWQEGLKLMPVGSKYMLYIPSNLAYGTNVKGKIPANSTLIFEVELIEIVK